MTHFEILRTVKLNPMAPQNEALPAIMQRSGGAGAKTAPISVGRDRIRCRMGFSRFIVLIMCGCRPPRKWRFSPETAGIRGAGRGCSHGLDFTGGTGAMMRLLAPWRVMPK